MPTATTPTIKLSPLREAAARRGIPYSSARDMAFRGEIRIFKSGGSERYARWYVDERELDKFIESRNGKARLKKANARTVDWTGGRVSDDARRRHRMAPIVTQKQRWQPPTERDERPNTDERIAAALEKIARLLDEGFGAYLNARFSGKGSDRWAR